MRYYELEDPHHSIPRTWTGTCRVERRWGLPGVECSACRQTWSSFRSYPAVDVSHLPERRELEDGWPKPYAEYARRAELVRPLCSSEVVLTPGSTLGPLHGTARGRFGPLTLVPLWGVLVREDLLHALQAEGMRGIVPVRPEFKKAPSPALFELHLLPGGRLHADGRFPPPAPPCSVCGWQDLSAYFSSRVEVSSFPADLDVFYLRDAPLHILATERFVEIAQSCGPSDVVFKEVETEPPGKHARG
ncbi:double-CXXCG motif protein [Myxococcus sp. RHSTA-1-4]|uniref:SitI6 family double-CXXCG motif immunity protein n=1 Tax=Myxococcus sp. RHSTA-1-4 TaxID=2874601 RepID=UPI001CBC88AB|nr:double-CXXCG motif protein [Myxococcus sp. RHSTA-1-4]